MGTIFLLSLWLILIVGTCERPNCLLLWLWPEGKLLIRHISRGCLQSSPETKEASACHLHVLYLFSLGLYMTLRKELVYKSGALAFVSATQRIYPLVA